MKVWHFSELAYFPAWEELGAQLRNVVSPANWLDWQRESHTLQGFAAWRPLRSTLTGVGEPLRVSSQTVSAEFFLTLGVKPLLGRILTAEDDRPAGMDWISTRSPGDQER